MCKILVISNSGRKSSGKIILRLIWEKIMRLDEDLET